MRKHVTAQGRFLVTLSYFLASWRTSTRFRTLLNSVYFCQFHTLYPLRVNSMIDTKINVLVYQRKVIDVWRLLQCFWTRSSGAMLNFAAFSVSGFHPQITYMYWLIKIFLDMVKWQCYRGVMLGKSGEDVKSITSSMGMSARKPVGFDISSIFFFFFRISNE